MSDLEDELRELNEKLELMMKRLDYIEPLMRARTIPTILGLMVRVPVWTIDYTMRARSSDSSLNRESLGMKARTSLNYTHSRLETLSTQREASTNSFSISFYIILYRFSSMSKGSRPECIGMYGFEYECEECNWAAECKDMDEAIEQAVTRKGTHVRLTGKYTEKKYKPKTSR